MQKMGLIAAMMLAAICLLGTSNALYFSSPNTPSCPIQNVICNAQMAYGCSGQPLSMVATLPPFNVNNTLQFLQRLQVQPGTTYLLKQVNMVYTYMFNYVESWSTLTNGVNFTIIVYNASASNPNLPNSWTTPLLSGGRHNFKRGQSGRTSGKAFNMFHNLPNPLLLSPGNYLFGIVGYKTSIDTPVSYNTNQNYQWHQTPDMNPSFSDDSWVYASGANLPYWFPPISNGQNWGNTSQFQSIIQGRLCSWTAGAVTTLSTGAVVDPTLTVIANPNTYAVRFGVRESIEQINVNDFVARMNVALNVTAIGGPYATVVVYTLQRSFECSVIEWFINLPNANYYMNPATYWNTTTFAANTGLTANWVTGMFVNTTPQHLV